LVRTCFVSLALVSANSTGLLQKLIHCPRFSSTSPNAALFTRLKYEVSGIDSHLASFLYQFRFCTVLWPCKQVISRHSAPSSTSVSSHRTAFRTTESDDTQTRTASSLRSSLRTLQIGFLEFTTNINAFRDTWVPVTTAWSVLRLWLEERPPIWMVAANILNKQSRTAVKGCSYGLGVGRGANKSSPKNVYCYEPFTKSGHL
jgi:hypothetical protein